MLALGSMCRARDGSCEPDECGCTPFACATYIVVVVVDISDVQDLTVDRQHTTTSGTTTRGWHAETGELSL